MSAPRLPSRPERGFTLIELLIAVTLGLLLTMVVAQLFVGSRRAYSTTDALSRMQENMRFAHEVLSRTVHLGGYKSSPNKFSSGPFGVFPDTARALDGTEGCPSGSCTPMPSDTLVVRYQGSDNAAAVPDNTVVDCTGTAIGANTMAVNTFTVGVDVQTNKLALLCNGVAVVPDVENMQILYGEDATPAPGDATADHWVTRDKVVGDSIDRVVAVRIALLFVTPTLGAQNAPDTKSYDLVGSTVPAGKDTAIRRVQTMTIAIRNRTP